MNSTHNTNSIGKSEVKIMMTQSNSQPTRLLVGACNLLLILCAAQIAFAQQTTPAHPLPNQQATSTVATPPAAKPAAVEESKPESGGIKIHGHWVLQVKNPDGQLVERREFDNALVTNGISYSGDQLLAALLAGQAVPSFPAIAFMTLGTSPGYDATNACQSNPPANNNSCYAFVNTSTSAVGSAPGSYAGSLFNNVQTGLSLSVTYSPKVSFVLSGNYTVPAVFTLPLTQIAAVETFIAGCYQHWEITDPMAGGTFVLSSGGIADITPSACVAGATGAAGPEIIRVFPLTYTNVPGGPVPVVAGQIVTVSVIISFS